MNDADLIKALGGPTKVAELLGYDKAAGGVQRVQNWLTRGIPAQVKVDHPKVFLSARRFPKEIATEPKAAIGEGA